MSSTDVESLQPIARHSNKCLHASLTCLAFAVVAIALGGAAAFLVVWREMHTQIELLNKQIDLLNSTQSMDTYQSAARRIPSLEEGMFKSGQLAYLRVNNGEIGNHTLQWEKIDFADRSSIGMNFVFDQHQRKLTVRQKGSYFIFLNLSFKSNNLAHSTNGAVKVTLRSKSQVLLTCEVKLTEDKVVRKDCLGVAQHLAHNSDITADMIVHGSAFGWMLNGQESGFGMFIVDSQ